MYTRDVSSKRSAKIPLIIDELGPWPVIWAEPAANATVKLI